MLKKHFNNVPAYEFGSEFKEFISIDYFVGCTGMKFNYFSSNISNRGKLLLTIKLVLQFKDGKICDARIPKRIIPMKYKEKYISEN